MAYRTNRTKRRKRIVESLEERAMLAGDTIPVLQFDDPVISEPMEPSFEFDLLIEEDSDSFGDTQETAAKLTGEGLAHGKINSPGDKDVFVADAATLTGSIEAYPETPGLALRITVTDSAGNLLATAESTLPPDGVPGVVGPAILELAVDRDAGGEIYITVEGMNDTEGSYSLFAMMESEHGGGGPIEIETDSELGDDIHSGNADSSATELTLENDAAYVSSNIDRDADSDVFRFTATREGAFVDTFAELPIRIQVLDSSGTVIAESDDHMPEDVEFEHDIFLPSFAEFATEPGEEYFISVGSTKGQVGQYELMLHTYDPPEPEKPDAELGTDIHGETIETATVLEQEHGFARVLSNVDSATDVDVFQFHVGDDSHPDKRPTEISLFGVNGLRLLNEAGEEIAFENHFEAFGPEVEMNDQVGTFLELDAGIYFAEVSGSEAGQYELYVFTESMPTEPGVIPIDGPPAEVDAELGEDVHGDDIATATLLGNDDLVGAAFSNIDTPEDRDVFAFVAHGEEVYFDAFSDQVQLDIDVFDADGNVVDAEILSMLNEEPEDGMPSFFEGHFASQEGQTYYLSIGSDDGIGSYRMHAFSTFTADVMADSEQGDDIHSGDLADATKLFGGEDFASVESWIDQAGDVDVFTFIASSDLLYLEAFAMEGQLPLNVELLDADGNEVPSSFMMEQEIADSLGGEAELTVGEKYFVRVSSSETGEGVYGLQLFQPPTDFDPGDPPLISDSPLGEDIHSESNADATELALDELGFVEVISNIDHEGDVDTFSFVGNGEWMIAEVGGFDATEMFFEVFAEDGASVATATDWGSLEVPTIEDDMYYVRASSTGADPGQYFIAMSSLPGIDQPVEPPIDPIDVTDPPVDEPGGQPIEEPIDEVVDEKREEDLVGQGNSGEGNDALIPVVADLNGDGAVNFTDFLILSTNFGQVDAAFADGDLTGDGSIEMEDFLVLAAQFGSEA